MELHQKSDASLSEKQPSLQGWLTPEQKQQLHDSAKECQERIETSEICQNWRERFHESEYKTSRGRR